MRNEILIQKAFKVYEGKMNKIYSEMNYVNESVSYRDSQLLMEGWRDVLKGAVAGAVAGTSRFLGKTVQTVSNMSSDIYDKGVELGKKALEIAQELLNKITEVCKATVAAIKAAPGKMLDVCRDLYASISNEVGEIWKKASAKGGEWLESAKKTISDIYARCSKSLSEGVTAFKDWATKNVEEFKTMVANKKLELTEAAEVAKLSTNESMKKIANDLKAFYSSAADVTKNVAKNVALFSIAIVVIPFITSVALAKETYKLGEETLAYVNSGIESLKVSIPQLWNEFKTLASEEYQAGREEVGIRKENHVYRTFEGFVYNKY
jgi:hypothetical protein